MCANQQPAYLYAAIDRTFPDDERDLSKVVAAALHRTYRYVRRLVNPFDRQPLKAFEIPAITKATGSFAILDALEHEVDRAAFHMPPTHPAHEDVRKQLAIVAQRFGELLHTNGTALATGTVGPDENAAVVASTEALIGALCEYRALVQKKADETEARKKPVAA